MKKLKVIIKKWLGIYDLEQHYKNLVSIGVDVHFKSPHMILVYSQFNGGQIREISCNFENLQELNKLVKELGERYQTGRITYDADYGAKLFLAKDRKYRGF